MIRRSLAALSVLLAGTPAIAAEESGAASGPDVPADAAASPEDRLVRSPHLRVHIVQRKLSQVEGKHEVTLYPAALQLNGKWTQHYGVTAQYTRHLQEHFGVQAGFIWNYSATESTFTEELIDKGQQQPKAATALLLQWAPYAGVELTPAYGKFAFYESDIVHFGFFVNAGVGVAKTRVQISPEVEQDTASQRDQRGRTFGDTGFKPLGYLGGGFRAIVGQRISLRIEVRDLLYSAKVATINGCNDADLNELKKTPPGTPTSAECSLESFEDKKSDPVLAHQLVQDKSSDVINNVGFFGGLSYLF